MFYQNSSKNGGGADGNCGSFLVKQFWCSQTGSMALLHHGWNEMQKRGGDRKSRVDLYSARGNKSKGAQKTKQNKAVTDGCFFLLWVTGGSFHLIKIAQKQNNTKLPLQLLSIVSGPFLFSIRTKMNEGVTRLLTGATNSYGELASCHRMPVAWLHLTTCQADKIKKNTTEGMCALISMCGPSHMPIKARDKDTERCWLTSFFCFFCIACPKTYPCEV